MRVLILGGTVFLGRAIAVAARDAGHSVTCAARGVSGEPVPGVSFVRVNRDDPRGLAGIEGTFDLAFDVTRVPSQARQLAAALAGRVGHLTFVSSISVYADQSRPHGTVADTPVLAPASPEAEDPAGDYGACKVSCERALTQAFAEALVCRAGLIVGPEDPTGRFTWWAERGARGGEILVPGSPEDLLQLVDVRDLAAWLVLAAARGVTGIFDGTGETMTREAFMTAVAGAAATCTYVDQDFLLAQGVNPWSGPRSLPVWVPLPEYAGMLTRDVSPAVAAGLTTRPLAETVRDTLGETISDNGITVEEEAELLARWHSTRTELGN